MSTPSWKPDNCNDLTPYLMVRDAEESLGFYEQAFGFERGNVMPAPSGGIGHAELHYRGKVIIMFAPEGAWGSTDQCPKSSGHKSSVGLYVYCEDVDALTARARAAGAEVLRDLEDAFWGDRMVVLGDPSGYHWTFATKVGEFDPTKIPQTM